MPTMTGAQAMADTRWSRATIPDARSWRVHANCRGRTADFFGPAG